MKSSRERGGASFTLFLGVLFCSILTAGVVGFQKVAKTNPLSPTFLEEDPPTITWKEAPLGLGADPVKVSLRISDPGSGLDEVLVRISQNNQPRDLLKKKSLLGSHSEDVAVTINPKELGLKEGKVELQVSAFDQSLWSNGTKVSKNLVIDFQKPRIEVITPQQNGVLGGTELVFYKVLGKRPDSQGVVSSGSLYPGFPAKFWDESFKGHDELYLAFFPIPQTFDDSTHSMSLLARDSIGNSATAPFHYRVRQRKWGSFQFSLDEQRAEVLKNELLQHPVNQSLKARLTGDLIADLKLLIRASARQDESILSDPLSRTEGRRLWSGPFIRPLAALPSNTVGDLRTFTVRGQEVMRGAAIGARFASSTRAKVVAANSGRVSFVGDLAMNGKTIVIDHGFGLATVYAHLSEITVSNGQEIGKGATIGRTGTTGVAQSEEVYFQTRLHGVPVSPNEWWDESWVRDHIENKATFVQRTLNEGGE